MYIVIKNENKMKLKRHRSISLLSQSIYMPEYPSYSQLAFVPVRLSAGCFNVMNSSNGPKNPIRPMSWNAPA